MVGLEKQQKAKRIAAIVSIVSGFLIYMATTEMELGGYLQLMSEKENPVFMIAIFWAILIYSPIYRFIAERSDGVLMPDGTYRGADLDTFNPAVCFFILLASWAISSLPLIKLFT